MPIDPVIAANMAAMDPLKSGGPIGKRLIPQIIDAYAKHEPERIWAAQARSDNISDGFRDVTFVQLAHCVNFTAWMLEKVVGRGKGFETVSYIGSADLRYCIFVWAAVKCGYQTLMPSTRNSESGNLSLMHDCNITKFFCSTEWVPAGERLKRSKNDMQIYVVPTMDEMLAGSADHYVYEKTFEEAENDPIICCHTSGSTGNPKPIMLTNHYFAAYDNHRKIPRLEGRGRNVDYATFDTADCAYYYNTFPPFHIAGIIAQGMIPILYKTTVLLGPVNKPPTGEICNEILKSVRIHSIYTPPTVLEQLLLEPGGLDRAGQCDFIIFSGGPLAPSAGDQIAPVVDLGQYIGSTEIGIIPGILPSPETWRYFEFHPVFGCRLDHVTEDEFELIVPHDDTLDWIRPAPYRIAPTLWRTKDLFKQHSQKSYAYRFHGRADDIVVLSNGEKFNPVTMEAIVQGCSFLSGALIVGQGRFQAALLVEPKEDISTPAARQKLVDNMWPWVQKANADGPAHAQLFKSKVIVTTPEKPLVRAGKGTVVRGKSTQAYEAEIDALYTDRIEDPTTISGLPDLEPPYTADKLESFICSYLSSLLSWDVMPHDDLFVRGMDSLQTNQIVHAVKSRLHGHRQDVSFVTPKAIYHNPTASGLAAYLASNLSEDDTALRTAVETSSRESRMASLVKKYTERLPDMGKEAHPRTDRVTNGMNGTKSSSLCVALTGSTGSLGTNLLKCLLEDPQISHIYCLDRSGEAAERHTRSFKAMGIPELLHAAKVTFRKVKFGHATFGLGEDEYKRLTEEVDVIIHNAWKVNFNQQLESFDEEHIRSVSNFIRWSLDNKCRTRIVFVSSLASVSDWSKHHAGPVPAKPVDDYGVARAMGYGESKHVAERILQEASSRSGVPATILRVGQIAGPTQLRAPAWNKAEWLPSLVRTSITLGCVPQSLPGNIDWIPVDLLAQIIDDILQDAEHQGGLQVFNLANPHTTDWGTLLPALQAHRERSQPLKPVPFRTWIGLLERVDSSDEKELETMPAAKILDFYQSMDQDQTEPAPSVEYETSNLSESSPTAQRLEPISRQLMQVWLDQWNF